MSSSDLPPSKKPEDSDFQQQRLKAWQPLLTPKWVIGTFLLIGIVFIPIGAGIVVSSNKVVELERRYDNIATNFGVACPRTPATCQGQYKENGCVINGIDYERSYTAASPTVLNVDACSTDVTLTIEEVRTNQVA